MREAKTTNVVDDRGNFHHDHSSSVPSPSPVSKPESGTLKPEPGTLQNQILLGDNLALLQSMPAGSVPLIYIDPPFNTGRRQRAAAE